MCSMKASSASSSPEHDFSPGTGYIQRPMRPGTSTGMKLRLRANGLRSVAACALLIALAAPAAANAGSTVQVGAGKFNAGQLRIDGIPGTPSAVEVRYRLAAEAGFGGLTDRFVVEDTSGAVASGADCEAINATTVSCAAPSVRAIVAVLGDEADVLAINAGKGDGVPARYPTDLRGQTGADVIRGGNGDDVIRGEAGRDVVAGWSGDDLLFGGIGADGLIGFSGDDTLNGDKGRDALFGQKGRDRMFGGPQNDVLLARDGFRDPQISCGGGKRQRAVTDRRDPKPSRCLVPKPKGSKKKK